MKFRYAAALILLAAQPARATVKDGALKWRAGDYAGAVTEWLPYAARGDADALFNLGQAYKLGRGVAADPAMAQSYFLKAAIKGHGPAQAKLGASLYAQPATRPEGIRWLTQAAAQDEVRAEYALGIAYFNGEGVTANRPLGYAYMRRAEKGAMPEATPALAAMLAKLTPTDKMRGDQLTLPAAPQGVLPVAITPAVTPTAQTATAVIVPALIVPHGFRVQLGAFASRAEADATWAKLTPRQLSLVGDAPPIVTEADGVVRLQVGPYMSHDAARSLCAKLTRAAMSCFVVNG